MHRLILTGISLALAACSSSGGGGSSGGSSGGSGSGSSLDNPTVVGPGQAIPVSSDPVQLNGTAVATTFDGTSTGPFSAPGSASVTVSNTDGDFPDTVSFTHGGEQVTITSEGGEDRLGGRVILDSDSGGAIVTASDTDLDYAVFAGWGTASGSDETLANGDRIAFGAFGGPTPAADRPSGDASYSGRSIGVAGNGSGAALTSSDIAVDVTGGFSAVTITSSNTVIEPIEGGASSTAPTFDFTASGSISADGYSASGGGMSVQGDFYGPNAEETAGVFHGAVEGADYGGAFGASR